MPTCTKCKCSLCHQNTNQFQIEKIDDKLVCHSCLYNESKPYKIFPIGFVENDTDPGQNFELNMQFTNPKSSVSKINLCESQKPFLFKLEDEKWITIVFYFHIQRPISSTFARGLDGKKVGVFASRTPFRLSRIGISEVELIKVEGTTLFVKNFDAFNGSPVLDIKIGSKSLK